MSLKESKSLQFNEIIWEVSLLGEQVILLKCPKQTPIEKIHESTHVIERELGQRLVDIVPAYHSIAVFTTIPLEELIDLLQKAQIKPSNNSSEKEHIELPICYELGLDIELVALKKGLKVEELIAIHLAGKYRISFIGFTPGFIYADGLDETLSCSRLENPRKKVLAGSVGIGGGQTGIYSLDSPGGWNIIGLTPVKLFDPVKQPPMMIDVGSSYNFYRITQEEFESWGS
ncbi:5-oxoprolinase subunit B family protein [Ekhidna sp.]